MLKAGGFRPGVRGLGYCKVAVVSRIYTGESMEKKLENEMETGLI